MYSIPVEFEERLADVFHDRLRCRWSHAEHAFVIEQRIARRVADAFPVLNDRDDLIRIRDGYMQVMSVRNGDRMPCPNPSCFHDLRVPMFETRMLQCEHCHTYAVAGFFELNDRLIDYLRDIDPLRDGPLRKQHEVNFANHRNTLSQERVAHNLLEDAVSDNFTQMAGIQSVGYTGKVFEG